MGRIGNGRSTHVVAAFLLGFAAPAGAEPKFWPKPFVSSGLRATLSVGSVEDRTVKARYRIENLTSSRQYLMPISENADGALGAGGILHIGQIVGAKRCPSNDPAVCFHDNKADLYIEPFEAAVITVEYGADESIPHGAPATFPLKLAVQSAGRHRPAQLVRFNFPLEQLRKECFGCVCDD